jgi:hypothetical protein
MKEDIKPRNDNGEPHGYWELYLSNELWYKSVHHNSKETGYEEYYLYPTNKIIKTFYII